MIFFLLRDYVSGILFWTKLAIMRQWPLEMCIECSWSWSYDRKTIANSVHINALLTIHSVNPKRSSICIVSWFWRDKTLECFIWRWVSESLNILQLTFIKYSEFMKILFRSLHFIPPQQTKKSPTITQGNMYSRIKWTVRRLWIVVNYFLSLNT